MVGDDSVAWRREAIKTLFLRVLVAPREQFFLSIFKRLKYCIKSSPTLFLSLVT